MLRGNTSILSRIVDSWYIFIRSNRSSLVEATPGFHGVKFCSGLYCPARMNLREHLGFRQVKRGLDKTREQAL